MLYRTELRHPSMPEGFEPPTFGFDALQTGSRSLVLKATATKVWSDPLLLAN